MKSTATFCCVWALLFVQIPIANASQSINTDITSLMHKFVPFTGELTSNKVRMRLQPTYNGYVLRELNRNDLVVVLDETDDFYAIQPPTDVYGYVFRTYVIDNVVEGNRVNVRLKPNLEAPVITQLNVGAHVEGKVDSDNNRWLEIRLPDTVYFYIAKDYVQHKGDVGLMMRLANKREEARKLLQTAENNSKVELSKAFDKINFDNITANYQSMISNYSEFPDISATAKQQLMAFQEAYTRQKLNYLEAQAANSAATTKTNQKLAEELEKHKVKVAVLQKQINNGSMENSRITQSATGTMKKPVATKLAINAPAWILAEEQLLSEWSKQTGKKTAQEFYDEQYRQSFVLTGIIDPYDRTVSNKPGDYMINSSSSKLPIAFLYSTHLNLQEFIGREVSVRVASRPNNNFAFPAYFVLSIE